MAKRHLKLMGDLGRVHFLVGSIWGANELLKLKRKPQEWDLRNTASIEESVRHSDIVYNLVGRDYPTKFVMRPRPRGRINSVQELHS